MMSDDTLAQSAEQASAPVADAAGVVETLSGGAQPVEAKVAADNGSAGAATSALKPGMRVKGKVRNVVAFGAFVDIGVGRDGLAHISVLQRAGIDKTLKVGDEIEVQVRNVDAATNRISLILPEGERAPKAALADLVVGATVSGRVVRLADFGAFVDIGAQTDALLHVSQLGRGYTARPSDVLKAGDEIQVRILEVDTERRRISLTMKGGADEMETEVEPTRSAPTARPRAQAAPAASDEGAEEEPSAGIFAAAWEKALGQRRVRRRRPGA